MGFEQYKSELQSKIRDLLSGKLSAPAAPKAAILTWCNNNGQTNYGQLLQCYAVCKLFRDMGFTVQVILYMNGNDRIDEEDKQRIRKFQDFVDEYIPVTSPCYTKEMLEKQTNDCELLVCGSDQIWNPIHFDPVYFLDFGKKSQKRISLAASGIFPENEENCNIIPEIGKHLERLDWISVRERCAAEILGRYSVCPIEVMPDPTLLLTKEEWDLVAEKKKEDGYILCYFMGSMRPFQLIIRKIAEKHGAEAVWYIPSNLMKEGRYGWMQPLNGCGPEQFLRLVRDAKAVCTDSFHGAALSYVYQVPVYCVDRTQNGADIFGGRSRIENLRTEFGLPVKWVRNCKDIMS